MLHKSLFEDQEELPLTSLVLKIGIPEEVHNKGCRSSGGKEEKNTNIVYRVTGNGWGAHREETTSSQGNREKEE